MPAVNQKQFDCENFRTIQNKKGRKDIVNVFYEFSSGSETFVVEFDSKENPCGEQVWQ